VVGLFYKGRLSENSSLLIPEYILVPIALFAPLSQQDLGTSRAKALPAKRSEKGYGDENVFLSSPQGSLDSSLAAHSPI